MSLPHIISEFLTLALGQHDAAHGFEHAAAVALNAVEIIRREKLVMTSRDLAVILYIMALHDIRDHKIENCVSEDTVRTFLTTHLSPEDAEAVIHIHKNCSWSNRKTAIMSPQYETLHRVLQDADWIEGMVLQRCIDYTTAHHAPEPLRRTILGESEHVPGRVCAHIREKLLLIPAELNYEASRQIVEDRGYAAELRAYLAQHEPTAGAQ